MLHTTIDKAKGTLPIDSLETDLIPRLKRGMGIDVLNRIEEGQYRPSKKLMEHVGNMIKGKPEYVLLD